MSRQKSIRAFPNGEERAVCNKCLKKLDAIPVRYLTLADLNRIEVALRLRYESCLDSGEQRQAGMFHGTHNRLFQIIKMARGLK